MIVKILRWIFYLPISLICGIVVGAICQLIIPFMTMGLTHQNLISQYIVSAGTIIIPFIISGVASGGIAGRICPAKSPYVGAITIALLQFIYSCISVNHNWDSDKLFISITSIIGYVLALVFSYAMAFNIKKDL